MAKRPLSIVFSDMKEPLPQRILHGWLAWKETLLQSQRGDRIPWKTELQLTRRNLSESRFSLWLMLSETLVLYLGPFPSLAAPALHPISWAGLGEMWHGLRYFWAMHHWPDNRHIDADSLVSKSSTGVKLCTHFVLLQWKHSFVSITHSFPQTDLKFVGNQASDQKLKASNSSFISPASLGSQDKNTAAWKINEQLFQTLKPENNDTKPKIKCNNLSCFPKCQH